MRHRIEIRDTNFDILEVLEKEATKIQWEYKRIGGCGNFSFILPRKFDDVGYVRGDFNIRIYKRTGAGTFSLWYQGLIEDRSPALGDNEKVQVRGFGYSSQLERIHVSKTYTSDEISVIVKDILDTYVTPNTNIAYDAGDIEATSFTADSLEFKNVSAASAFKTLADLVGTREWGVGKDRKFFFKARSTAVNYRFWLGKNITKVNQLDTFRQIINRMLIEGGDVAGTKYTRTINRAASQVKYGLREKVIQNAAIVTNTVADQYGSAVLDENENMSRRVTCEQIDNETLIEDSVPLGMAVIKEAGIRYSEKYYGVFLYAGVIEYQINKILYKLDDSGGLSKKFSLGKLRPSTTESLKGIEYEIEQLRAARE